MARKTFRETVHSWRMMVENLRPLKAARRQKKPPAPASPTESESVS